MKSIFAGTTLFFLLFLFNTYGQNQQATVKDSIHIFYNKLFQELEENYLYTKDVDWSSLKPYIKKRSIKK